MDKKFSTKGMILDISSMRSRARKLLDLKPEYSSMLECLTKKDYYYDDDAKLPTVKELAAEAGVTYAKARTQLQMIYEDLCSYEPTLDIPFEFKEVEIQISITGYNGFRTFTAKSLPIIPRKGEMIQVAYFKELTGTDHYHVDEIYHSLMDGKQQLFISLKQGSYDAFWKLRRDQAKAMGEISWQDAIHKSDSQLADILELRPGKAW